MPAGATDPTTLWNALLRRYPTIAAAFADATSLMPISFRPLIQHRLAKSVGKRWALMPHAYAFVDPLFSTGIAWSLRAVERLAQLFETAADRGRVPEFNSLLIYDALLTGEADQIDLMVAGAYEAMAHFELFAAHAMLYFGAVSFAEASQRLAPHESSAWRGFLGVDDSVLAPLPREALGRLRVITKGRGDIGTAKTRRDFSEWVAGAIAPRNIAGLANPARANLYPVDFDALVDSHELLGLTREQIVERLPALRGMSPPPAFDGESSTRKVDLAAASQETAFFTLERGNHP